MTAAAATTMISVPARAIGFGLRKGGGGAAAAAAAAAARRCEVNGRKVVNGVVHGSVEAPLYVGKGGGEGGEGEGGGGVAMNDAFKLGKFVEERFVYRQTFVIRSYEIGPDKTATMETLMNLLQETALNHVMSSGLASDGFGATHQMSLRQLIWVVTRINIQVEKYSRWGDVIEIDTWVAASGKNGMRRDWIIRDYNTKRMIASATSNWDCDLRRRQRRSIDKLTDETAENIRSGLAPRWSDMDVNQHVNNVKYIGWILESVPLNVLEEYHLTSITLEYRRECRQSQLLESLTSMMPRDIEQDYANSCEADLGSTHLIRLQEDKAEIVRARAEWRCKENNA
uniref:Acyl-[acyl-carrier-protein] hydrolase n=1 Tax=Ananas comosus var. bracteatus TaxID=296719 RepID=A0A6V7QT39_ANACO